MKQCFKCKETKPLEEFYKHKEMADGHLNKCKACTCSDVRKHRRENDSVREYDRRRYHENVERRMQTALNTKIWERNNPEGYKAHYILSNAIRDGRIKKQNCEICNSDKVHGHHEDYSKPLEVRWLCALHHHRLHAE